MNFAPLLYASCYFFHKYRMMILFFSMYVNRNIIVNSSVIIAAGIFQPSYSLPLLISSIQPIEMITSQFNAKTRTLFYLEQGLIHLLWYLETNNLYLIYLTPVCHYLHYKMTNYEIFALLILTDAFFECNQFIKN